MFCKYCGNEVNEKDTYCTVCGAYMKDKPQQISIKTEETQFCHSCGEKVTGRYCENCGQFNIKVQLKENNMTNQVVDFVKQATSQIKTEEIKNKLQDTARHLETEKLQETVKEKCKGITLRRTLTAIKQGLIFSSISVGLISILSLIIGGIMQSKIKEYFVEALGIWDVEEVLHKIGNWGIAVFHMFFGSSMTASITLGKEAAIKYTITGGCFVLIITALILLAAEKIRGAIAKEKLDMYAIFITSVLNGIITSIVGLLFSKHMNISMEELGLYYYDTGTKMKMSIMIDFGQTFLITMVLTFAFFYLFNIRRILGQKFDKILSLSKHLMGILCLIALCPALMIGIRLAIANEGEKIGLIVIMVIVLFVAFLIGILTWNVPLISGLLNGETLVGLKMGLLNFKVTSMAGDYTITNPFKIYFIIFAIITLLIVLYYSVHIWHEEKAVSLKDAIIKSSIGATVIGIFTAMISLLTRGSIKTFVKESGEELLDALGESGTLVSISIGNVNYFAIFIKVFLVILVMFMIGYLLHTYVGGVVEYVGTISYQAIVASVCIGVLIISVISVMSFKTERLLEDDFVYEIENVVDQMEDYLEDDILDILDF